MTWHHTEVASWQYDAHVHEWFWWTVIALVLFSPNKDIAGAIATAERVLTRLRRGKTDENQTTAAIAVPAACDCGPGIDHDRPGLSGELTQRREHWLNLSDDQPEE